MEAETRRKIEETVIGILKKSDMEKLTEFKVRLRAAERLGIDLSGIEHKRFVRSIVESYLLSTDQNVREEGRTEVEEERATKHKGEAKGVPDRLICKLSNRKKVVVQSVKGQPYISIREYGDQHGNQIPSRKGINLTSEQWSALKTSVPAIQEAVTKMQTRLRSAEPCMQNGDSPSSVSAFTPKLVPFESTRFDGKNYHCWAQRMEMRLKQLKIAYVLTEPCPSLSPGLQTSIEEFARTKAGEQNWRNDDYVCMHNILSSLSDHLFYQYSKKTKSAKELWEELKLVYLYEEYGTKRSLVKKYLEFQMVDARPILDQVQELNNIADSIAVAGMPIHENFHVSSIISKLPLSWKDFYIKLLREPNLPFPALMSHLRAEEESRNQNKQPEPSNPANLHTENKLGARVGETKKRNMTWIRKSDADIVCDICGNRGHIASSCWTHKLCEDSE